MKKTIRVLLLLCLMAVAICGCGKKTVDDNLDVREIVTEEDENINNESDDTTDDNKSDEVLEAENAKNEEVEASDLTGEITEADTAEVVNNGHYFVKVGDRVYFREYGTKALENPVIWGRYLSNPTGEQSYIDYYDETTGKTVQAFRDFGYGKIVYIDGCFFMNGLDISISEYGTPYVYAVKENGDEIAFPEIIHGTINDVSKDGRTLLISSNYVGNEFKPEIMGITLGGEKVFVVESENYLDYIGTVDDYVIYAESVYETGKDNRTKVWCRDIYSGDTVLITKLKCSYEEALDFGELFSMDGKYYMPVISRAGSGDMFQSGDLIEFVPGKEDSANTVAAFKADEEDDTPFVTINGVKRSFNDSDADTLVVMRDSYDEDADLYLKNINGDNKLMVKGFIPAAGYYDIGNDMTLGESVDGNGYIMYATQVYDPEGSVGWRDGFRLLKMEYLRLNNDGTYNVIQAVVYE